MSKGLKSFLIVFGSVAGLILIGIVIVFIRSDFFDEKTCPLRKGRMIEMGCGIANCRYRCAIPYKDGGKSCTNSSQCSHRCVTTDPRITSQMWLVTGRKGLTSCVKLEDYKYDCSNINLVGHCEEIEQKNCEERFELNDGIITPIFFLHCTM